MDSARPLLAGVLLLLVAACGDEVRGEARARPTAFAERAVTWAQGSTLHYGERAYDVGPGVVTELWRTSYGFLFHRRASTDPDASGGYYFFDGTTTTRLRGDPSDVHVSPDGRYAGWIDFDGPKRPTGRLAAAVVVDLRTGTEVVRDRDQMGGPDDDLADLYEDAEVHFLGFDTRYAYWDTPTGEVQRRRAEIGSWRVGDGSTREGTPGEEEPIGLPYDSLVGEQNVGTPEGSTVPTRQGLTGFRSPSREWCLTDGMPGRLWVDRCGAGRREDATPAYPTRSIVFGGWQSDDRFYVLAREHYRFDGSPGAVDRSVGVITSCTLPSGSCTPVTRVSRTDSIVFATGMPAGGL